ncbi:hypothetical protein ACP70R_026108 [Stipagrostis hirtigluma subsp. patula]
MKNNHIALAIFAIVFVVSSPGSMAATILGECSVTLATPGPNCVQKDCSVVCAKMFENGVGICNDFRGCYCTYLCDSRK